MTNILGDGDVTTIYPVYDDVYSLFDNVSGFFKKINVDDGAIHINQAGHGDNVDDAHTPAPRPVTKPRGVCENKERPRNGII